MQYTEENNYPKAVLYSSLILILFILISYLIILGDSQPIGTGGMVVNFGTAAEGMGTDYMNVDEPSVDPNANNTPPDKVVPNVDPVKAPSAAKSNQDVITQDMEDAPSVAAKDKKSTAVSTSQPTKESKPTINPNALYKGKKNPGTGGGDGTTTTPGNQGSINGDVLATNYGEGGSGNGDLSLTNRSYVSRPRLQDDGQATGRIVVEIKVDRNGQVLDARAGVGGTTITSLKLWEKCRIAALGAKLNSLESAPEVQIGKIVFNFKVD